MNSRLRLLPLGIGDAFSSRFYTTCLGLECDGEWLLLDCPHPIRKMMREASQSSGLPLDVDRVLAVALSHLHADHASGIEGFGYYNYYVLGRRARLAALPEVASQLWTGTLSGAMGETWPWPGQPATPRSFEEFFELDVIDEGQAPLEIGPFRIVCRRSAHSIPCAAFRVEAAGRTFAFSGDAMYDEDLIRWLADGADLIVHEATAHDPPGPHTRIDPLAAFAVANGFADRLRVSHYPDDYPDRLAPPLEPLRQGVLLEV